jgi:carbonic anhydrase
MPKDSIILSQEEQQKLTPSGVLQQFIDGNTRFRNGEVTKRNHSERIRKSAPAQFPKAIVLSCLDSRVPVEDIFDQGIGDIFVARIAGNFVNDDILGSMEFACKIAGAKLILILGHQHCGAISGVINNLKIGFITKLLSNLKPALKFSKDYEGTGQKDSDNPEFVKFIAIQNVKLNIQKVRKRSKILNKLEQEGKIKIIGAFYRLTDGSLEIIEN